jgi:trk system potassium uptake protein
MAIKIGVHFSSDRAIRTKKLIHRNIDLFIIILSFLAFSTVLYDLGFTQYTTSGRKLGIFYSFCLLILFGTLLAKYLLQKNMLISRGQRITELVVLIIVFLVILVRFTFLERYVDEYKLFTILNDPFFIYFIFIFIFLIEVTKYSLTLNKLDVNPALLFVGSFVVLIFFGAGLLMLPNATVQGIRLIDAVFTAASAVCVTGLIVVDTATYFTFFGKTILLLLIQIGGLGVMTFTSFLGFFFKGSYSLHNQIFLKEYINENNLGEIFKTLAKIIIFTLSVELLGAVFIYFTLSDDLFATNTDKIEFSVFHAISAFCNAGFSTLTNGLYEAGFRDNYSMQMIIALLVVVGGLGFPVIFNYYNYVKHVSASTTRQLFNNVEYVHVARVVNANTRLVVNTTFILLIVGFVLYFIGEYNHTLKGLPWYGKVFTSIFGSVTPRTAGFNTVDMTAISLPTILIYLILMWIGASPGSTGGGLKTTTFAVAVLNTLSIAKAKDRVEVFRREITNESVRKAFAVILLSFLVIGLAVFLVTLFNPEQGLIHVAFECFSAFSTVGLSLGITGNLSDASKMVLAITMFLGRVGSLTILMAFIRRTSTLNYRYPSENVFIM